MRFHWQNLNKSKRKWLHRRCWIGNGWGVEVVSPSNFRLELELNSGDYAFVFTLGLVLFSIYIHYEDSKLYNLLEPVTKRKDQKFTNGRSIGVSFHNPTLWIKLWDDQMESRTSDPKWWAFNIDFLDLFLGKKKHVKTVQDSGDTLIHMPEGNYKATYEIIERTWKRPRWFSKSRRFIDFDIKKGIPFYGKGTTAYNIGMDAIFGTATEWNDSIYEATKTIALRCLEQRSRTGSLDDPVYSEYFMEKELLGEKGE